MYLWIKGESCWLSISLIAIAPDILRIWRFFYRRVAQDCDGNNRQNIKTVKGVMPMKNWLSGKIEWLSGKTDKEIP